MNMAGNTPLVEAAIYGHVKVADVLLAHGANVNAKDNTGKTALDMAQSIPDAEKRQAMIALLKESTMKHPQG